VYSFDYLRPASVGEALGILADVGEEATVLAGGQSLMILLRQGLVRPEVLVGLRGIDTLAGVQAGGGGLTLGAMTPYVTVAAHPEVLSRVPILSLAAASVGSVHIRNRGTIGGSICHADPAGDVPTVLLACHAELIVTGPGASQQRHRAEGFFTGLFETRLGPGQLLTGIDIGAQPEGATFGYRRFSFRPGEYPMCVAAARLEWNDGHCSVATVAVGGAGDRPLRLPAAEARLAGVPLAELDARRLLTGTRDLVSPPPDVRGSGAWKARAVEKVLIEAVHDAREQARRGAEPGTGEGGNHG
jgi:carbon-monoxide dehydrogenase medium subunit